MFHDLATFGKQIWESGFASTFFSKKIDQMVWFCDFSNRHMARCFLHYLLILLIRMSGQIVRFRIKILRKITVTQFFLKDKSEEKVPNFALDRFPAGGIFSFRVEILIFMHSVWCVNSFFVYNHHHVILNSHVLRVLKRTIESSGKDFMLMCHAYVIWLWCSWVKITDFSLFLKDIVPFCFFSCIYSILKT